MNPRTYWTLHWLAIVASSLANKIAGTYKRISLLSHLQASNSTGPQHPKVTKCILNFKDQHKCNTANCGSLPANIPDDAIPATLATPAKSTTDHTIESRAYKRWEIWRRNNDEQDSKEGQSSSFTLPSRIFAYTTGLLRSWNFSFTRHIVPTRRA